MLKSLWLGGLAVAVAMALTDPVSAQNHAVDPDTNKEWDVTDVTVAKVIPGPALWKISKDDRVLWVIGTMPISRTSWDGHRIERLLDGAHTLYLPPSASGAVASSTRKLPKGTTLRDLLPDAEYARFRVVADTYRLSTAGEEKEKPYWAGLRLSWRIRSDIGISSGPVQDRIVAAAKKRKVRITQIDHQEHSAELNSYGNMSMEASRACLADTLNWIDYFVPHNRADSEAWANGDVVTLKRRMSAKPKASCRTEDAEKRSEYAYRETLAAVEQALSLSHRNVMIYPIDVFLGDDRLALDLEKRGYKVTPPGTLRNARN